MEATQDISSTMAEKLKPYESRIAHLEALEQSKQTEIDTLKTMVRDLHYLLEDLKADKQLNSRHN